MQNKLDDLKNRLREVEDLNSASAVLSWDQATYMPPGGAPARGRQMGLLSRLAHERFTDPAVGRLLDELRPYEESLEPEHDDAADERTEADDDAWRWAGREWGGGRGCTMGWCWRCRPGCSGRSPR